MANGTVHTGAPSNALDEAISSGGYSLHQITVVVICLLLNMIDGFDITAMAYAAPSISDAWGITADKVGIVFSATLAGMMIGAMFLAPISDQAGRRLTVIVSVLVIGISMIATGFAESLPALIVLRFVSGLGVGTMLASLAAIGSEYSPERYRAMAVTVITVGYPLGAALGGLVAAPLIPIYGWESIFFAAGMANLMLLAVAYFLLPESLHFIARNDADGGALERINSALRRIQKPQLGSLPLLSSASDRKSSNMKQNPVRAVFGPVSSLLTPNYRVASLMIWLAFFFAFVAIYFLLSWVPTMMVGAGYTQQEGVYAATAMSFGSFVGILIFSWFSTRKPLSSVVASFMALGGLLMIGVLLLPQGYAAVFATMFLIGVFGMAGFTALYAIPAKVYSTERRATGIGWAIGLGRFGAVAGPYVAGLLVAAGVSMGVNFAIFAIPMLLAALVAYLLKVK